MAGSVDRKLRRQKYRRDYICSTSNPNSVVPWVIKQEWDGDDDTDIEYIAMHILEANGFDCNSQELANQWLGHI